MKWAPRCCCALIVLSWSSGALSAESSGADELEPKTVLSLQDATHLRQPGSSADDAGRQRELGASELKDTIAGLRAQCNQAVSALELVKENARLKEALAVATKKAKRRGVRKKRGRGRKKRGRKKRARKKRGGRGKRGRRGKKRRVRKKPVVRRKVAGKRKAKGKAKGKAGEKCGDGKGSSGVQAAMCPSKLMPKWSGTGGYKHCKRMPGLCCARTTAEGKKGHISGCVPSHEGRNVDFKRICLSHFGADPNNNAMMPTDACPDGIGPDGAAMIRRNKNTCTSWDAQMVTAAGRLTTCNEGAPFQLGSTSRKSKRRTCTTMVVKHPNLCEGDSGVLIFKRVVCNTHLLKCDVFKVGACIRVNVPLHEIHRNTLGKSDTKDLYMCRNTALAGQNRTREAMNTKFAQMAREVLKKHRWDQLPPEHQCRTTKLEGHRDKLSCAERAKDEIATA